MRRILLAASLTTALAACEPVAALPPPPYPPPPGAPRIELRADGSYVKDGRVRRDKLSDIVSDHPASRARAIEYEHDHPIGVSLTATGIAVTLTGMATVFPGLIAKNDPLAVVGGVHLGVGLCVLAFAKIMTGSARWEHTRAIDLYNEHAAPAPLVVPAPVAR